MPGVRAYLAPVGLPVAVSLTGAVSGVTTGATKAFAIFLTIVCVAGTAIYNKSKQNLATNASTEAAIAREELAVGITSAGQVLIRALGRVSAAKEADKRDSAMQRLVERVVDTAKSQCGSEQQKNRAAFYEKRGNLLVRSYFSGRHEKEPRPSFEKGTDRQHDEEVFRLADGTDSVLFDDIIERPPPHFVDAGGRTYRTFMAAPVRTEDESYGFLSVDSPTARSLSDNDLGYLIFLARILGAGLALKDRHPDTSTLRQGGGTV